MEVHTIARACLAGLLVLWWERRVETQMILGSPGPYRENQFPYLEFIWKRW